MLTLRYIEWVHFFQIFTFYCGVDLISNGLDNKYSDALFSAL